MAYGDNRSSVASDTFDTSISASWENGGGDWAACSWATGGHVQASANSTDCAMRRSAESFNADQYSKITAQTYGTGNEKWMVAGVRMQSGANESSYMGATHSSSGANGYEISETNSSLGFSTLATTSTGWGAPSAGNTITLEVEGTTLRLGDNRGTDTQRLTTTDNTLASGSPGVSFFASSAAQVQITAWEGGNIGATGPNPIAGASAQAFTNTGALTGTGALAGSAAQAFSNAGALTGEGELAGSAAQAFTNAGALDGKGELAASADLVFANTAVLGGDGELAGAADLAFANTAVLGGTGELAGAAALTFANEGTLELPAGALEGSAALAFTNAGALTGTAELGGDAAAAFSNAGQMHGLGELAGSADLSFENTGTLTVGGGIAGSVALSFAPAGVLTGTGELAGAVGIVWTASATATQDRRGRISPSDAAASGTTASDAASSTIASSNVAVTRITLGDS